jgi:hypothetical protein
VADNLGQIPEDVDQLASEFELKAGQLEELQSAISGRLNSAVWTGPDRDRFQADWDGALSQNITQVIQQLRGASQIATQNAQQQRDGSA